MSYTDRARAIRRAPNDAATAIPLENFPVPGAGAFLGRNEIFGQNPTQDIDGDGQPDFVLLPGQDRWFRFTTLGDGQPGSQLLLAPAFEAAQTSLLRGNDARFDPTPPADHGSIELGNTLRWAARPATRSSWSSISRRTWIGATI